MTEAVGLVGYARKNGLDELGIIAAPFHQLRAVITTVSVLKREHPRLRVYNYAGDPLALDGVAVHSQGTTTGVRADLFFGELERIVAYHEKGDLVSLEEALKYLEERDRASSVSAAA